MTFKSRAGLRLPRLVVFDLDACLWTPEMFQLSDAPSEPVLGPLGEAGDGVVAMRCPGQNTEVRLFPGALRALQEMVTSDDWNGSKIAAASSSLVPEYSQICMDNLEVFPGMKLKDIFEYTAIGRTGELSSDKRTHFNKIYRESSIAFNEMLFFDDCIWGDNVAHIERVFGVPGVRTPDGITDATWEEGIMLFASSKSS